MGTFDPLNAKKARHIAAFTGLDVVRAYGTASYLFYFATAGHRHGVWDKKTGEWWWEDPALPPSCIGGQHFPDCPERFGDTPTPDDYPHVDYAAIAIEHGWRLRTPGYLSADMPTYIVEAGEVSEAEVEQAAFAWADRLEQQGCTVRVHRTRSLAPKWIVDVTTTAPFRHTLYVCDWIEPDPPSDAMVSALAR